ncbi:MAG: hypothetical protein O3C40_08155 [Planctomycetota bacterium]|nr:hypothetical protein [Planctomycetota bacterium]
MHVSFEHCGQPARLQLADGRTRTGPLRCNQCGALISTIDVAGAQSWMEAQVTRKRELTQSGRLATRKQSTQQSDEEIDRDGLSAELAACAILCPGSLHRWRKRSELSQENRGRDLLRQWTGLNQPVEVKHTRYQDAQRGFLLVRPPRQTPGRMREEYIDDAYYVLLVGAPYRHSLAGWTNRDGLIRDGKLNPVPIQHGQRESWGLHWSKLRPIDELVAEIGSGGPLAALARWLADLGDR